MALVNQKGNLTLDIARNYMTKMVGVDFLIKLLGYLVRFKLLFLAQQKGPSAAHDLKLTKVMINSIVESRMLSNAFKGPSTLLSSLRALAAPTHPAQSKATTPAVSPTTASASASSYPPSSTVSDMLDAVQNPTKLLTVMSLLLRSLEQISSDGGYLARYILLSLNGDRLSHEYKRWKSLSLTCMVIVEIMFLVRYVQQRMQARNTAANIATRAGEQQQQQQQQKSLDIADGSGDALSSPLAPNPPPVAKEYKYRFQTLAADVIISDRDATMSGIVVTRCLCDMYIYYKWIPSWQPPEALQYSAGIVSAVLGIYLVLDETIRETLARAKRSN